MPLGYVEELTLRYFEKDGYITMPNVQFQLDKERVGKKVAGWSDIDLIAISPKEFAIIQCKSYLGTKKAELIAREIINWFDNAVHFVENDKAWSFWIKKRKVSKYLIVDHTVIKAENLIEESGAGIEICYYKDLLIKLLQLLQKKVWRKGKEDDAIIRLLCAMIDNEMINPDLYKIDLDS